MRLGQDIGLLSSLAWWTHRVIVINSPLVALMEEQNQKLQVAKIKRVAIHANHMPAGLEDQLVVGEYQAVFMSPETIFEHPRFSLFETLLNGEHECKRLLLTKRIVSALGALTSGRRTPRLETCDHEFRLEWRSLQSRQHFTGQS
jgi:hypothetical protein